MESKCINRNYRVQFWHICIFDIKMFMLNIFVDFAYDQSLIYDVLC